MATSSVAISSTRRGWRGHFTVLSRAANSRIPNTRADRALTRRSRASNVARSAAGAVKEALMPLDPQAQKVVDAIAALNLKAFKDSTPAEARDAMRTRTAALGPVEDVPAVADHRVPVDGGEITVRLYAPAGVGPHPVM